eukprot:TRINITY_DN325_c0_g1_i2.p1 TRINITY_DN325_c0_g1~~TRINITY_DN325_c0_g1_i2.p1  ORF type:complete len:523 (+),score=193.80 TRINITY_DN325_c0_g1_i2:101-1669(+)
MVRGVSATLLAFIGLFGFVLSLDVSSRQGDILIAHASNSLSDDSVVFLSGAPFNTASLKDIDATEFSSLIGHVMNLPIPDVQSRDGFPQSTLLDSPKANFLVIVDGVGSKLLNKHSLASTLAPSAVPLNTAAVYPPNTASIITTLTTGTTPATHGIVGSSWYTPEGELVSAFKQNGASAARSLAYNMTFAYDQSTRIVSASGCETLALALSNQQSSGRSFTSAARFIVVVSDSAPSKTFLSSISASISGKAVTVYANNRMAEFSLGNKAHSTFLGELEMIFDMANVAVNKFSAESSSSSSPAMFSVAVSGLRAVLEQHGEDSEEFAVGLFVLHSTISSAIAKINAAYKNKVASEVVFLNSKIIYNEVVEDAKASIKAIVQRNLAAGSAANFDSFYPYIYLSPKTSASDVTKIQNSINMVVAKNQALAPLVLCAKREATQQRQASRNTYYLMDDIIANNNTCNNTIIKIVDTDYIAAEHMLTWVPIILTLLVLMGVYGVCGISKEMTKDTLLFRSAGRHMHQS